jgi:hypothetical protein
MTMHRGARLLLLALMVGCTEASDPTDPGTTPPTRPETSLNFTRPISNATLSRDSVVFWAVRGQDREVSWFYRPLAGSADSVRFLRFRVRNDGLLRRPDGTTFANGDSVRIVIRMRDFSRLIAEFSPSGLVFNPARPAELKLDFKNTNPDYNRDGVVNQLDADIAGSFAIWKQETDTSPWIKLSSVVEVSSDLREVKADVLGFTNYAVAW